MDDLKSILRDLISVEPSLEWVAFGLCGGKPGWMRPGDSFGGFSSFEISINENIIRNIDLSKSLLATNAKSLAELVSIPERLAQDLINLPKDDSYSSEALRIISAYYGFDFQKFSLMDSVLNSKENSKVMLDSALPKGTYLRTIDGFCSGVLFIAPKTLEDNFSRDLRPTHTSESYSFDLKKGFKGIAIRSDNIGVFEAKLAGGMSTFLELIKASCPAFNWGAFTFAYNGGEYEDLRFCENTLGQDGISGEIDEVGYSLAVALNKHKEQLYLHLLKIIPSLPTLGKYDRFHGILLLIERGPSDDDDESINGTDIYDSENDWHSFEVSDSFRGVMVSLTHKSILETQVKIP